MSGFLRISVDEAEKIIEKPNRLLLDMRDARSFCESHHPDAVHLNDNSIRKLLKNTPKNIPIVIYCYHGNSSQDMAKLFADFGFDQCYSVDGGYDAWRQSLTEPKQPLSEALCAWLKINTFNVDNLDARVGNNETALMRAARQGLVEHVDELIDAGASIDVKNADGNTALWLACYSGNETIVKKLIDADADLDNQNDNGATALIYSASAGKTRIVQLLVNAGADTQLATLDDFTALDVAANIEILRYLRQFSASKRVAMSG
ncbi:MAG: ankyrin repeat domain-containing protein [Spongiibacteraceae bacterium]